MAPSTPRLRILSVGGNAVSAFISWRLQATNACDVTLVWKSQFESVAQYGISMKSSTLGNERFKPYSVVPAAEDAAANSKQPFDYVLLCVKALPDVYDLANIIQSVVAPQHTCILLNTTNALGIEDYLAQRFPTNVILSLVCGADLIQLGSSEFEQRGSVSDIWVGWANRNSRIPEAIQKDMAEALAMTLTTGSVNCVVSNNIRQQQFDRVIGPIAFHPASVLFDCPNHAELLELTGVRTMVINLIDELVTLAKAHNCQFPDDFRETTIQTMVQPLERNSIMYQDFVDRRPMEVETYLGSPSKLAKEVGISVPRVETLYALLHHKNAINLKQPAGIASSPNGKPPPPRASSIAGNGPRPPVNGAGPMPNGMPNGQGRRMPFFNGPQGPMRRGPSNGFAQRMPNGHPNGYPSEGMPRRSSIDEELGEFSHVMLYDNAPEGGMPEGTGGVYGDDASHAASTTDLGLRERELALRHRELEMRERHMHMRRGPQPRRPPPNPAGWDDDEDEDFFDPMSGPPPPVMDENFDMMSVTSRRTRKAPPSHRQMRADMNGPGGGGGGGGNVRNSRNPFSSRKNRTSTRIMADMPNLTDSILANPLMGYSSNRYANVDRGAMGKESRQNSLTTERLDELQRGGGMPYHGPNGYGPPPIQRRQSQSPGNPLSPPVKRPSPPNGYSGPNGHPGPNGYMNGMNGPNGMNGRPSPPGMRQPVPRHPPGHGNSVAPSQVEQHAGVSNTYPHKSMPQVRSLTGSASASAASGESSGASALLDSSNSSANSVLVPRGTNAIQV